VLTGLKLLRTKRQTSKMKVKAGRRGGEDEGGTQTDVNEATMGLGSGQYRNVAERFTSSR